MWIIHAFISFHSCGLTWFSQNDCNYSLFAVRLLGSVGADVVCSSSCINRRMHCGKKQAKPAITAKRTNNCSSQRIIQIALIQCIDCIKKMIIWPLVMQPSTHRLEEPPTATSNSIVIDLHLKRALISFSTAVISVHCASRTIRICTLLRGYKYRMAVVFKIEFVWFSTRPNFVMLLEWLALIVHAAKILFHLLLFCIVVNLFCFLISCWLVMCWRLKFNWFFLLIGIPKHNSFLRRHSNIYDSSNCYTNGEFLWVPSFGVTSKLPWVPIIY